MLVTFGRFVGGVGREEGESWFIVGAKGWALRAS